MCSTSVPLYLRFISTSKELIAAWARKMSMPAWVAYQQFLYWQIDFTFECNWLILRAKMLLYMCFADTTGSVFFFCVLCYDVLSFPCECKEKFCIKCLIYWTKLNEVRFPEWNGPEHRIRAMISHTMKIKWGKKNQRLCSQRGLFLSWNKIDPREGRQDSQTGEGTGNWEGSRTRAN